MSCFYIFMFRDQDRIGPLMKDFPASVKQSNEF